MDTSAWYAFFNYDDPLHKQVRNIISESRGLVTSNFIIDEILTLLLARQGHASAVQAGEKFWIGALGEIIRIEEGDERTARDIFCNHPGLSFTDCTSFALMRRLGIKTAVALDEDFRRHGFRIVP